MEEKHIILLIGEDEKGGHLLQTLLQQENEFHPDYEIVHVRTLNEGRQHLLLQETDIIMLDLSAGKESGMDSLALLRSEFSDIPITVMTGANDEALAFRALNHGAHDYLNKNEIDRASIERTIRHAMIKKEFVSVAEKLRSANDRLEKLSLLDPVTELFNRRGFQQALSREILRARRDGSQLQLLIVDLDDFKKINQTLGLAVGDVVLKEIALKLKSSIRAVDYAGRLSGDKFLILMPHLKNEEALRVAERIRLGLVGGPISLSSGGTVKLTATIGVVPVSLDLASLDDLLADSEEFLGKSKLGGKNRVANSERSERPKDEHPLFKVLSALRCKDRFSVLVHAIIRLEDESKIGYEFLSRTSIEDFEMPDDFFRVCLENNILTFVDHQCLKNCVASATAFPLEMRRHLNLFPSTIIDIPVEHLLDAFPVDKLHGTYCIELSEQQIIGEPLYLAESISTLKSSGVLIAIDDVGFGRSCLENLITLEPDIVKIDKKCVFGISKNKAHAKSLKRLLNVAEALGTEVVAEGIETKDDLQALKDLGVKYGQGFLFGRPSANS